MPWLDLASFGLSFGFAWDFFKTRDCFGSFRSSSFAFLSLSLSCVCVSLLLFRQGGEGRKGEGRGKDGRELKKAEGRIFKERDSVLQEAICQ